MEQGFDFAGWEVSAVQAGEAGAALLQLHRRALQLVLLHLQHTAEVNGGLSIGL